MSATDRELLELAAKAAGVKLHGWTSAWRGDYFGCFDIGGATWNPLTDDGDALRLAVKLAIQIEHSSPAHKNVDRVQASPRGFGHLSWVQMYEGDSAAATRYAIVRAAAELGKEKP